MKLAQGINFDKLNGAIGLTNPPDSIGAFVGTIVPYVFAAAGFLLVIFLVVGGLEFIFSFGDPKKTTMARGKITNALLGFLIVFAAYLIVQVVATILGITDIKNIFK